MRPEEQPDGFEGTRIERSRIKYLFFFLVACGDAGGLADELLHV
jgi:hypothetical protein